MSATDAPASLRERRERLVREHAEAENVHDFDTALGSFAHPRYEIVPSGEVIDGPVAVAAYYRETRSAFPDQRNEIHALHHADDAVVMEFTLHGTHRGSFRGLPPTGRAFSCRMLAVFAFEGDRLVAERVYFDQSTILRQLGIAHDPLTLRGRLATVANHPRVVGGAVLRQALGRVRAGRR
jgi:steroid delta-isomerase-like uncharacterized protein